MKNQVLKSQVGLFIDFNACTYIKFKDYLAVFHSDWKEQLMKSSIAIVITSNRMKKLSAQKHYF